MGLILRLVGFIGGITFIVTGFGVLGDPNCNSVSFSGLHAVTETCYPDSTGAIPAWLGGILSIIGGLILMGYAVSPFLEIWLLHKEKQKTLNALSTGILESDKKAEITDDSPTSFSMPETLARPKKQWYKRREIALPLLSVGLVVVLALVANNSNSGSSSDSSNGTNTSASNSASSATYSQVCSNASGGTPTCLASPNWSYAVCSSNANGFLYQEQADKSWSKLWAISGVADSTCSSQYPYDVKVSGTINNLTGPINLRLGFSADATNAAFNSDFQIYPQQ
jgi:hypothetical protein